LIACTTKRLLKIKGFSDIKVEKIKEAAKKMAVRAQSIDTRFGKSLIYNSLRPTASSPLLSLVKSENAAFGSRRVVSSLMLV
jgi:2-oxoglutarate dehydrogenase complex dehydrogenase (E1) component-like enzyme